MPSNLIILVPLLAGFIFSRICYYTRFRAQTLEGYRLLMESAVFGFGFLAVARFGVAWAKRTEAGQFAKSLWSEFSVVPYSGTVAGCVFVAVAAALCLNIPMWESWRRAFLRGRVRRTIRNRVARRLAFCRRSVWIRLFRRISFWSAATWSEAATRRNLKKRAALNWATRRQTNQLLLLFNEAALAGYMVSVTLTNRKFYVGYVKTAPSLDPQELYFRLYPIMSGYRDATSLTFEKTTDYNFVQDIDDADPFFVTLPVRDVQVANPFDAEMYARHFQRYLVVSP